MILFRRFGLFIFLLMCSFAATMAQTNQIGIELYKGTSTELSDIVYCNMRSGGNAGVDNNDLPKLNQFNENVAVVRNGLNFGIETRPLVNCRDTVQLNIYRMTVSAYRLVIDMNAYPAAPGLTAVLQDIFLNTTRTLKFGDTTRVNFSVTSNAASAGLRFRILFTRNLVQTAPFTQLDPVCRGAAINLPSTSTNGVKGTWSPAVNNTQTTSYTFNASEGQCATTQNMTVQVNQPVTPTFNEIGPFISGSSFTLPSTSNNGISGNWSPAINSTQTTTYTFTPNAGQCANTAQITVVINFPTSVLDWNADKGFKMYPNPISKSGSMQLAFQNKAAGMYRVSLMNIAGARIKQTMVSHAGGSAVHSFMLDNQIGVGIFLMEIMNDMGEKEQFKMVVE
jgi:hypothetical protein